MSLEYRTASKIIDIGLQGKSIKKYCSSLQNLHKSEYALALQTLKYLQVIKDLLKETESRVPSESFFDLEDVQKPLLYVMIYDLLFSKRKRINGGGAVKKKIMAIRDALQAVLEEQMQDKTEFTELLSEEMAEASSLPLYIRVNTVMTTSSSSALSEAREYLQQHYSRDNELHFDDLIPSLIALPSSTKGISQDSQVKGGKFIIQDKASCFPSQILNNLWNHSISDHCRGQFIDCCAAPGNKTSHLAACLAESQYYNPSNHILHAFEKNRSRYELLQQRMKQYQVTSLVQTHQKDFLTVDPLQFSSVTHILLDPSCSGSGIVRNIERFTEETTTIPSSSAVSSEESDQQINRIQQLQSFQLQALKKAISFPSAQFVVYSTCSIHQEENEIVVSKLLSSEEGQSWEITEPIGFESWERRGQVVEGIKKKDAKKMIRCLPADGMNGFFVAAIKRKQIAEVTIEPYNRPDPTSEELPQKTSRKRPHSATNNRTTEPLAEKEIEKEKKRNKAASNDNHVMKSITAISNHSFRISNRQKRKFGRK